MLLKFKSYVYTTTWRNHIITKCRFEDGSLEHGIAIILVVAGTGLIYIRTRKNQHNFKFKTV